MKLMRLSYENFKAQTQDIVLNEADVDIFGANGVGKTTAFDAFTWLLFGKDSNGCELSDDIKKRSAVDNGEDHAVEALLLLDGGEQIKLKRVFHEKWTKKRGSATDTFSGHDTEFYVDDVPVKKKDYTEKINSIMDESCFKLLTDPLYFREQLSWQERRKILIDVCGDVADDDVLAADAELAALPELMNGKSLDDYRKMMQSTRTKLNDELKKIPVRIDEVKRTIPDVSGINEEDIQSEIRSLRKQQEEVARKIATTKAGGMTAEKRRTLAELDAEQIAVKNRYDEQVNKAYLDRQMEIGKLEQEKQRAEYSVDTLIRRMGSIQESITKNGEEIQKTRAEWHAKNDETFSVDVEDTCPTCGQKLPAERVQETVEKAEADFNLKKSEKLIAIREKGKKLAAELEAQGRELECLQNEVEDYKSQGKALDEKIASLKASTDTLADYKKDAAYIEVERKKQVLLAELEQLKSSIDDEIRKLEEERKALDADIEARQEKLGVLKAERAAHERIAELVEEQKKMAVTFEETEHALYLTDLFIRTKVRMLDEKINSKFRIAQFRLFETQVNGGVSECCAVLYDGVERMSNSQGIKAGLDIIKTLSEHYGTTTPIFVDNCESVTELPEMDGQIIRLIVSADDKKLRIERKDKAQKAA